MVNILVPTDFSDLSKVAIKFAIKVANKLDGNITLLHVITITQPTRASLRLKLEALERELIRYAKDDFEELVAEVSKDIKTTQPLQIKTVIGSSFNDTVKKEAKRLRSGLIVMGTRGASGLKKLVMGSNTASMIEISHVPVLAVPELAVFKNFKNIVYATDLQHVDRELKALAPYVEKFGSSVHMIHVTNAQKGVKDSEALMEKAILKGGYKGITARVLVSKNIDEALELYVESIKAELITLFAHESSFYDKLFDRSITRKVAFQSKIPLLAFKQR